MRPGRCGNYVYTFSTNALLDLLEFSINLYKLKVAVNIQMLLWWFFLYIISLYFYIYVWFLRSKICCNSFANLLQLYFCFCFLCNTCDLYFWIRSTIFIQTIHMYRRAKYNRNDVVKLRHESTTRAMMFTLKVLPLYNTTNSLLKARWWIDAGIENYSVRNTQICVIYLFRPE